MAAYATHEQLSEYTGIGTADLPSNVEQMLARASELVDVVTLKRIDTNDSDHATAAQKAVCAQVEYWIEAGESVDISGAIQGYTIGSLQIQYGAGANRIAPGRFAPRAKQHLFLAGLLYRGVKSA